MIVLSSVLYLSTMILLLISTKIPSLNDDFMLKSKWQRFLEFPDYRSKLGRWRAQQVVARGGLEQVNWSVTMMKRYIRRVTKYDKKKTFFSVIVGRIGTGAQVKRGFIRIYQASSGSVRGSSVGVGVDKRPGWVWIGWHKQLGGLLYQCTLHS